MWNSVLILYVLMSISACAVFPKKTYIGEVKTVNLEEFAAKPFGFVLTLKNFEENYKKTLKRQRYFVENLANPAQTDTIYTFYKGKKTKIIFYQQRHFDGRLMGGRIRNQKVELNNGIRTGLTRREFFEKFADWEYTEDDTLIIESPATGSAFSFSFSRNKLKEINITIARYNRQ